jgi:type IV pilus assembly protein PilC
MRFRVTVRDRAGKRLTVYREAENGSALARTLSKEGLFAVEIAEDREGSRGTDRELGRVSRKTVEEFSASLALLLESGLSFKDALSVQSRTAGKSGIKTLTEWLLRRITRGCSFSAALAEAGHAFPPVYRGLVRVGERTAGLERVMKELASYLEEERKIREKISNALLYPALVLSAAFAGTVVLAVFVLPRMNEMFSSLGSEAAANLAGTAGVIKTAAGAAAGLLGCGILSALLMSVLRRVSPGFAVELARLSLKVPVLGAFTLRKEMLSFAFAMETLCASGVPMEDALSEAAGVLSNRAIAAEILIARERVIRGARLSDALAGCSLIPGTVRMWVGIGEETGGADRVFRQLSAYYRRETETFSARLMVMAEPAVTLLVGAVVLALAAGFVVPLFGAFGSVLG